MTGRLLFGNSETARGSFRQTIRAKDRRAAPGERPGHHGPRRGQTRAVGPAPGREGEYPCEKTHSTQNAQRH
jgi:hypothetical protein